MILELFWCVFVGLPVVLALLPCLCLCLYVSVTVGLCGMYAYMDVNDKRQLSVYVYVITQNTLIYIPLHG